jgi:hypothetical protein
MLDFLNRSTELAQLERLHARSPGLAVIWGRRRIGKTRLMVEWCRRAGGLYVVADQSDPEVQRAFVARALAQRLPGFDEVRYPDWERLLSRVAADAKAQGFRGPLVFDELPYLVATSPELPSVLQRWVDHAARDARLTVALAGSSQRMMQGLILDASAPLYGRAQLQLEVGPLSARHLPRALGTLTPLEMVAHWTAWGGVPRYWELAADAEGTVLGRLVALALAPGGPLFAEPERLLLEETPSAAEMRPLLDAIGGGAHRVSELAGRTGRPATSLSRPLDRLIGMGLIRRETPYGEPPRGGKRSLYKVADPFLRMWFRVVAPNRAALVAGTTRTRTAILKSHWPALLAQAWEEMCREAIGRLREGSSALARLGPWRPAQRYWHGENPEWDVVADAVSGERVLLGEAWYRDRPVTAAELRQSARAVLKRPVPPAASGKDVVMAILIPSVATRVSEVDGVRVVTLKDLLATEG